MVALEQSLFGLGPCPLQLDGCRLIAPMPLRKRLGGCGHQRFALSLWHGPRLRIIPEAVWPAYLDFVCHKFPNRVQAENLRSRLGQACALRKLDNHHRWDIPVQLAQDAGLISSDPAVVLLPCRFWFEVIAAGIWRGFLMELAEQTRAVDLPPSDFEI